jgi:RimJ/RimL family protein N-acetyltransferase
MYDDDLADLLALANNWAVARWVSSMPHPYTEVDGRKWIERVQRDHATGRPRLFAIALNETDRLVGSGGGSTAAPKTKADEWMLGYWLGQPYWGQGYGREAVSAFIDYGFRTLGVETILAYTDLANIASQKVLIHCGLATAGELDLDKPTRQGSERVPLFRISRRVPAG